MRLHRFCRPLLLRAYRYGERPVRWLSFEILEDRTVPAVVLWDGGAGTANWQDPLNWSTDALPGATDAVQILGSGSTVNLSSGTANVASVLSDRGLNITASALTTNSLQVNGALTVGAGGSISNAQILAGSGSASVTFTGGSLLGVRLDAAATASSNVKISNGLVLNNRLTLASSASFVSTQSVSGTGDFYFSSASAAMRTQGNGTAGGAATVTIGPGITVHGSQSGSLSAVNPSFDRFINQGTIASDTTSRTITVSNLDNQGSINAAAGTIALTTGWTNTGTLNASGGVMTIGSSSNSWTNAGSLNLSAGTLNLAGAFTQASLGTFSRTGGTVNITGTLTGDLALNSSTGSIGLAVTGTLKNSIYTSSNGAVLIATSGGTLDNVTLGTDLSAGTNKYTNGLHLNGHVLTVSGGTLNFAGTQAIDGAGEIVVSSTSTFSISGTGAVVTIGAGVVFRGAGTVNFSGTSTNWINQGTINAEVANNTWTLNNFVNQGTITASAGTVALPNAWTNTGTLRATGGTLTLGSGTNAWTNAGTVALVSGTLNLAGAFTQASLGTFNRSGGTVQIAGTLSGNLSLNSSTGGMTITSSGTLKDSTYNTSSGSARLDATGGTLDNVTLGVDFSSTGTITVKNGLNLNGNVWTHGSTGSSVINLNGAQTISGAGTIVINSTASSSISNQGTGIVTIGAGVNIQGNSSTTISGSTTNRIVNQGKISSSTAGKTWTISNVDNQGIIQSTGGDLALTSDWTNTGTLKVGASGSLTIGSGTNTWTNAGSITLATGTVNLGGTFTQAALGTFTRSLGTVNITGTMTGNLALSAATGSFVLRTGTLKNSTYTSADGAALSNTGGTMDNVTLGSDFTQNSTLALKNGINLNGHVWTITAGTLFMSGSQTIAGPGEIRTNGTSTITLQTSGGNTAGTASLVTIGSGVIIHGTGSAKLEPVYAAYDRFKNQGSIIADTAGKTITIQNVDNYGLVQVAGGNIVLNSNYTQMDGETRLGGSANPTFGGSSFTTTIVGGTLTGSGTISGNLINQSDVSPGIETGSSIGTINVTGSYTQQATGRLIAEVFSSTASDQLIVSGAATIDGTLIVNHRADDVLTDLATYPVLTGASVTGTFANVFDGDPADAFTYTIDYTATAATITAHVPMFSDLNITSMSAPSRAETGSTIAISTQVLNGGTISLSAGSWHDDFYLSSDNVLDAGDYRLTSLLAPPSILPSGNSYTLASNAVIPSGTTAGNYYLFVVTNADHVVVDSNPNNDIRSVPLSLYSPSPDLTVSGLAVTYPHGPYAGKDMTIQWNDFNNGSAEATGSWSDRIQIVNPSIGVVLDTTIAVSGPISPGTVATRSFTYTLPSGIPNVEALVITITTDSSNNVAEDNLQNSAELNNSSNTGNNYLPTLTINSPITIFDGQSITLTSGASGTLGTNPQYSWDINGDGVYGDIVRTASGSFSVTWATLSSLGISSPDFRNISYTYTDSQGSAFSPSTTLTVNVNTPPTALPGGPYEVVQGSQVVLNASGSTDPDLGQQSSLSYGWDFNNDGAIDVTTGAIVNAGWSLLMAWHLPTAVGVYPVTLTVMDNANAKSTATTTIQVLANTPPNANITGGPYVIDQGQSLTLSGTGSDPDPGQQSTLAYSWDINGDGTYGDATGAAPTLSWSTLNTLLGGPYPTTRNVTLRVTDVFGAITYSVPTTMQINANLPPVADAGGPYTIHEGDSLTLNASASYDPNSWQTSSLTYSWDVDGNGSVGNAAGVGPTLTWSQLKSLGIGDGNTTRNISVRATDSLGLMATSASVLLTVLNAPPTLSASAFTTVPVSQSTNFTLTATDPSSIDQAVSFTYAIDWNGDGTVDQTVNGLTGLVVAHTFATAGTFNVQMTATDKDGGTSTAFVIPVGVYENHTTGPYTIAEGTSLSLSATSVIDSGDAKTTFAWDLNLDGTTDVLGRNAIVTGLTSLGFNDGPVARPIKLIVTNSQTGQSETQSTFVTVTNVAPTSVSVSGPTSAIVGQNAVYTVTAIDPSSADQAGNFTFLIDLDGNGTTDQTKTGPSGTTFTVSTAWPNIGSQTMKVYARDKDGATSTAFGSMTVDVSTLWSTNEGGSITLSASSVVTLSSPYSIAYPHWDFNDDGIYDASGSAVTFAPSTYGFTDGRAIYIGSMQYNIYDSSHPTSVSSSVETNFYYSINNVAPSNSFISGPSSVPQNVARIFTLSTTDASPADTIGGVTFDIDWNGDSVYDQTVVGASGMLVSHIFPTVGNYTLYVRATDKDGGVGPVGTMAVNVFAPTTTSAGGTYAIDEGSGPLVIRGSTQLETGDGNTSYTWDLNGDGVFGDAVGSEAFVSAQTLAALGLVDGPVIKTVTMQAYNSLTSQTATATTTLTMNNVAPTASISGPSKITIGSMPTFVLSAYDPSIADQSANFTFNIDWDNDGTYDQTVVGPTGTAISHLFATSVSQFRVVATDKNGAQSSAATWSLSFPTTFTISEGQSLSATGPPGELGSEWILGSSTLSGSALSLSWSDIESMGYGDGPSNSIPLQYTYWTYAGLGQYSQRWVDYSFTIANTAPSMGSISGPSSAVVGIPQSYTLTASDPSNTDATSIFTFDLDWNGDGTVDQSIRGLSGLTVSHTFLTAGTPTIRATAIDKDGVRSSVLTKSLTVSAAVDSAFGPYTIAEGQSLSLVGSSSVDQFNGQTTYGWDFNGDGQYTEAVGSQPTLTWAQLQHLGLTDNANSLPIRLQITNSTLSYSAVVATTLNITNASPTATLAHLGNTFVLGASDPSNADQAKNFTFQIDWDGDGTFDQTVIGPAGTTINHAISGLLTVKLKATDKDGGASTITSLSIPENANSITELGSDETRVNSYSTGSQGSSHIVRDAAGNYLVVWNGAASSAASDGIRGQFYLADGTPKGSNFTIVPGPNDGMSIAMEPDGDFIVAWVQDNGYSDYSQNGTPILIMARRFDAYGVPRGDTYSVADVTAGDRSGVQVAVDAQGDSIIAWHEQGV